MAYGYYVGCPNYSTVIPTKQTFYNNDNIILYDICVDMIRFTIFLLCVFCVTWFNKCLFHLRYAISKWNAHENMIIYETDCVFGLPVITVQELLQNYNINADCEDDIGRIINIVTHLQGKKPKQNKQTNKQSKHFGSQWKNSSPLESGSISCVWLQLSGAGYSKSPRDQEKIKDIHSGSDRLTLNKWRWWLSLATSELRWLGLWHHNKLNI